MKKLAVVSALLWLSLGCSGAPRPPWHATLFVVQSDAGQGDPVGPVGDIDGDGREDFLLGGEVLSGRDGSVLSVAQLPATRSMTLADFDGDGVGDQLDLGVCSHRSALAGETSGGYTQVLSGRTGAHLGGVKHEHTIFRTWPAIVGDVNADGVPDLVVPGSGREYFVVSGAAMMKR